MPTLFIFAALLTLLASIHLGAKIFLTFLLAVAATYSSGNGVLAWPLVAILLIAPASRFPTNWKKPLAVLWAAAAVLSIGLYFVHYTRPAAGTSQAYSPTLGAILQYNLAFIGGPFAFPAESDQAVAVATLIGSILLLMLAAAIAYFARAHSQSRQKICDRMLPWLLIALYGLLSGVIASLIRAGFGSQQALSSRYITYAIYIPIALVNLIAIIADDLRSTHPQVFQGLWARIPALLAGAMVALYALTYPIAVKDASDLRQFRRQGEAMLLLSGILPNDPMIAPEVGDPADVSADAPVLNEMGYLNPPLIASNIATALVTDDAGDNAPIYGSLDANGTANGLIQVAGWAFNRQTGRVADGVFLTYLSNDKQPIIFAAAKMNLNRTDIAQRLNDPRCEWSGWIAAFPPSDIPQEIKTAQIRAWALDIDRARAYPLANASIMRR
jgi:hypothetical protein